MKKALFAITILLFIGFSCGLFKKKHTIEQPQPVPQAEIGKPLPPNDAIIVGKILEVRPDSQGKKTYILTVQIQEIKDRGQGFKFNILPKEKIDIISLKAVELKPDQIVKLQITGTEEFGNKTTFTLVKIY